MKLYLLTDPSNPELVKVGYEASGQYDMKTAVHRRIMNQASEISDTAVVHAISGSPIFEPYFQKLLGENRAEVVKHSPQSDHVVNSSSPKVWYDVSAENRYIFDALSQAFSQEPPVRIEEVDRADLAPFLAGSVSAIAWHQFITKNNALQKIQDNELKRQKFRQFEEEVATRYPEKTPAQVDEVMNLYLAGKDPLRFDVSSDGELRERVSGIDNSQKYTKWYPGTFTDSDEIEAAIVPKPKSHKGRNVLFLLLALAGIGYLTFVDYTEYLGYASLGVLGFLLLVALFSRK